ncbi:MAG: nuclear transport factor 2 family protein [Ignavibacteriales bacterium]|nr:nuclear transport factor 2 family protein [Ignavibacteriota bacterium]MCB9249898.1 nuclear transport factor 2 family protein [Ignavibacteriales bacterium]
MKKFNQAILLLTILIIGVSNSFAADNDVENKINQYLSAVNQKETKTLDTFINDEANFTMLNKIVNKNELLNEKDYLKFIEDGKSAWITSSKVKDVNVQGDLAVAYIESEGKTLVRKEYVTLVNSDGNWEIINSVSALSKK